MISIITPAHNVADILENCIENVREQSFRIEHLIIDGSSSDYNLDILEQDSSNNLKYISEPDLGIYD